MKLEKVCKCGAPIGSDDTAAEIEFAKCKLCYKKESWK